MSLSDQYIGKSFRHNVRQWLHLFQQNDQSINDAYLYIQNKSLLLYIKNDICDQGRWDEQCMKTWSTVLEKCSFLYGRRELKIHKFTFLLAIHRRLLCISTSFRVLVKALFSSVYNLFSSGSPQGIDQRWQVDQGSLKHSFFKHFKVFYWFKK